jgi:hypothetical protein
MRRLLLSLLVVAAFAVSLAIVAKFLAEKPPPPSGPSMTLGIGKVIIKARLGQSGPGEECPFTPLAVAEYPAGTRYLAYEVSMDPVPDLPMDFGVKLKAACATASITTNRCNQYGYAVNGEPVNKSWVEVVHCSDGGPFKPGTYKLQVLLDGSPMKEITFRVK